MIRRKGMPYEYHSGVSGIFAEVYFPKKALYQGTVYNALWEGLDNVKVRCHIRRSTRM